MDVVLAVLKPKPGHASHAYRPQLYEILLLDSKIPSGDNVKPAKYMPMFPIKQNEEEPRELVLTQLHKLTGIKGERALQVQWNSEGLSPHRESLSEFSLFFVPVGTHEKPSKKVIEQAQNSPGFYPLEDVHEALSNGSVHFPSPTRTFLTVLENWLRKKHQQTTFVECLFRPRAEFRVHFTVHNPVFIPSRLTPDADGTSGSGTAEFPPKIQLTANEALAKMLAIEKCDIVVMNPLFGSGLPYKTKVNAYEINHHWPNVPSYGNGPRWRDRFPLHSYAAAGDDAMVDILLERGHNHSALDSISWAPIHYATWYDCVPVLRTLLSAGCSPNLVDGEMNTPLHIAAKKGYPLILQCLLQCPDIDVNARDKDGKRPLDVSLSVTDKNVRHEQVIVLLSEAAHRPDLNIEVFLMDKTSKTLQLTSGYTTTVQQLNLQMMKEFNLPQNYSDIFTMWICSKSLELQLKLEHQVVRELRMWRVRSVNMLTEANPSEEEPSLTWRRNVKVSVEKEKQMQHPKALDLLFHEAYHNYINGLYPCKDKDIVTFATIVFCLNHRTTNNIKSALSNLVTSQLKQLIPSNVLKTKEWSHWTSKIAKDYPNFKDATQHQLKSQFLNICQRLTVYGSAFFTGNISSHLQSRKSSTPHNTHCYVGVNDNGMHIINIHTKQMVQSLEYREIKWKLNLEKSLLEVKVIKPESRDSRNQRSPTTRGMFEIRTRQAGLIDHLMHQLNL